jgi:hypothetical protein
MRCGSSDGALDLADIMAPDRYIRYLWWFFFFASPGLVATAVHHMSRLHGLGGGAAGGGVAWGAMCWPPCLNGSLNGG